MVRNVLLGRLDSQPRDDMWVKRLKRYRRSWYILMGLLLAAIVILEIQQNFTTSPMVLFAVAAVALLTLVIAESIDSRIQLYESEKLNSRVSDEEARARYAKIGFGDERRVKDDGN